MNPTDRRRLLQGLALAALGARLPALAHGHDGHEAAAGAPRLSPAAVQLPPLVLTRQDGRRLPLAQALDDGRPVLLDFIFTTCTAICPVLSQVFAETRERLGAARQGVHFVSLTIDPEHDTPRRLAEYAARFGADDGWSFFTGSEAEMARAQQAFGIYRGDKMSHAPATFIRAPRAAQWTRVDGFASPALLVGRIRGLSAPA